jgi:hypothetical protein
VFETNLLFPSSDEKLEAAGISDNVRTCRVTSHKRVILIVTSVVAFSGNSIGISVLIFSWNCHS